MSRARTPAEGPALTKKQTKRFRAAGGRAWLPWRPAAIGVSQIALAALVVVAPSVLLLMVCGVATVLILMWALGGEATRMTAPPGGTSDKQERRPVLLPALWTATLATFVLLTLDVRGLFTHGDVGAVSPLRYMLLPLPAVIVAIGARNNASRSRIRRSDVFLSALLAWGLVASLVYKVGTSGSISGLSMFLPMLLTLLHFIRRGGEVSERSARRMLDVLVYVGFAYILVHLAAGVGVPGISRGAHGHEKGFFIALAIAAAFATKRRKLAVVELVALVGIYLSYPAATYVTTACAVLVTVLLISPRRSGFRSAAIAVALPTILLLGFSSSLSANQQSFANSVLPRYFAAIGKSDNSEFRREMLKLGLEQARRSPVIGANFTAGFALPTKFRAGHQVVLPHNDYLELALAGGLLALGLFLGWALGTNTFAMRRYRVMVEAGAVAQARVVWVLLIGFNACLSIGLFQPVLFEVGTVTMFFLIYGCLRLTCEAVLEPPEASVEAGEPA